MNSTSCNCSAKDVGLLIIRVGLGACFIAHGAAKIWGGKVMLHNVGAMGLEHFGFHQHLAVWGLLSALAEAGGGIALVLGFLVRPAAFAMALNMIVAISFHIHAGQGFSAGWSHPLEDGIVFLGLLLMGAGACSLDAKMFCKNPPAFTNVPKT
jgi:putative oxidoreductase